MSGATAKAIRRDLRRAAGVDAVEALDACIQVIDNRILPNIGALQKLADLHEQRWQELEARVGVTTLRLLAFEGMTLRERFRWLIMGR